MQCWIVCQHHQTCWIVTTAHVLVCDRLALRTRCHHAIVFDFFNPRSLLEKIVTRSLEGGVSIGPPPPSTFDTIHPIDLKFGTYNKLRLYFQLSETTWCLIGFHGNNSQIHDVTGGHHLGFSSF